MQCVCSGVQKFKTDRHVCVVLKGLSSLMALVESGSFALHTVLAFTQWQKVKQTMGGVSEVLDYFIGSAYAA